jgi:hypothetical protein
MVSLNNLFQMRDIVSKSQEIKLKSKHYLKLIRKNTFLLNWNKLLCFISFNFISHWTRTVLQSYEMKTYVNKSSFLLIYHFFIQIIKI